MIARRLRPIGWVAGVAGAALSFYLVSLQVASERTELERVERRIAITQRQIRHLETEFSARASLRQLEAYNHDVLALAAPKVGQYLTSEVQLAAYAPGEGGMPQRQAPDTALASASATAAPAPVSARARPVLRQAVVPDARSDGAPVIPALQRPALIQAMAMIDTLPASRPAKPQPKPQPARAERVASLPPGALLDNGALTDLARTAAREAKAQR